MGYCKQISIYSWWWLELDYHGYKNWQSNILHLRCKIYSLKLKHSHPFSDYYRPRSKASEGYVFTCVCHSFCSTEVGGGVATPKASGQHPPPPSGTRWTTPRSLPRDQVTTPPLPQTRWTTPPPSLPPPGPGGQHPPPPYQVTTPSSPPDQVNNTPSPPGPGHNTSLPPPGPGHNTSLPTPPPQTRWTTPPPPGPGGQHPPGLCAGGRYASYWNALLLLVMNP